MIPIAFPYLRWFNKKLQCAEEHLDIETILNNKTIRLNSRNYTNATGDSIGFQSTPNQTVDTTGEVYGAQLKPRAAAGVDVGTVNGLGIDSELKSGDGNASGDLRGINMYLGATGTGTITGDVVGIRMRNEVSATVTADVCGLEFEDNEGSTDWNRLLKCNGAALGTHGMTTASDKTGNAKSGTLKVEVNGTLYHLQLYADS